MDPDHNAKTHVFRLRMEQFLMEVDVNQAAKEQLSINFTDLRNLAPNEKMEIVKNEEREGTKKLTLKDIHNALSVVSSLELGLRAPENYLRYMLGNIATNQKQKNCFKEMYGKVLVLLGGEAANE
jgi:hypothetical protein